MKKIQLLLVGTLMASSSILAQQSSFSSNTSSSVKKENEIKLNLMALASKSVSIQYERQVARKKTFTFTFRTMPKSTLPFKNTFKNSISDSSTANQLDDFKTANIALMPSIRFYLSRRGAFHGFYIAPFVEYGHYSADLPYKYYDGEYKTIPLSGSVNTFTGGIMFGAQWSLSSSVSLDWWIFGPHYGSSKGSVSCRQSLSQSEQDALKSELDNLDIPLTKTTNTVDANGAVVNFSGPWAGIRSGLCLGIKF
ncbi:MAG TPA: DUF3575 domain-containing protein [Hanamia sp.]|nr:DUF3575 domain-containing protein [Hanamia sp.]